MRWQFDFFFSSSSPSNVGVSPSQRSGGTHSTAEEKERKENDKDAARLYDEVATGVAKRRCLPQQSSIFPSPDRLLFYRPSARAPSLPSRDPLAGQEPSAHNAFPPCLTQLAWKEVEKKEYCLPLTTRKHVCTNTHTLRM